jgi:MFS family permease
MTIFTCSIGAATQGWDQTGSNGANLSFPVAFNIPEAASEGIAPGAPGYVSAALAERNQWIVGIVNAAPYIASAMIGCWLSDPLNNLFGRRGCIFITAVILVVTPIASGFTQNWWELFIVRLLLGIGMGAKGSTVPVFAAENSPAQIRGALVMGWQLWTVRIHPLTTLFFNGMIPELTRETLLFILCFIRLLVSSSVSLQTSWSPTRATFRGVCSLDPPSSQRCPSPSSSTSAPNRPAGS